MQSQESDDLDGSLEEKGLNATAVEKAIFITAFCDLGSSQTTA